MPHRPVIRHTEPHDLAPPDLHTAAVVPVKLVLRQWSGLAFVLLVATSFAIGSTLARLAYEAGSNALSVLTLRTSVASAALYVLLRLRGVGCALPPRRRYASLAAGVLLAAYSYGLLGAMEYIPVALAVTLFYTYPMLTAISSWLGGIERVSIISIAALAAAFFGIGLALDVSLIDLNFGGLNPIGIALALAGAVVFAGLLMLIERIRGSGDSRPITLHMLATAFVVYLLMGAVSGTFALPDTTSGWIGYVGSSFFYTFAIVSLFVAVSMIGPLKTALTMNFEPMASAICGFLILGQSLGPTQILGIAIVIAAIGSVHRSGASSPR